MTDILLPRDARPKLPDLRGLVVPVLFLGAWLALVDTGLVEHPLLVPLTKVLSAPFVDPDGQQIWVALGISLLRGTIGFVLGASLGVTLGILLGLSRTATTTVSPTIHTLRQITLFAWIPLLTAWFGTGEGSKLVFIALSAFFPTFLNTELGLRTVPLSYREVAIVTRMPVRRRIIRLMLPGALPSILIGLEIALLTAWIGTIGAEYAVGSGRGIGAYLAAARELFRMDLVLIGVLVLAIVGYGLSLASRQLFRFCVKWKTR
ncbi:MULTISPECIES: ABC transporter permease [unclassified Beijerinckia]|uniref:ABC transporter permease n=1 Tax=unclassified Beijerinckia TaxID=2638183 RepID=UPI000894E95A|nr:MULTISPECIES: ABC transporter permease [unclassified Beijerinckia]MDH7795470.1 sulfonate transport system permease protein [Beijerinckia sp. GAS462]SEC02899.1 sulfonate transport system permease protein [Beijerinckia sp. 28-YEA-48]